MKTFQKIILVSLHVVTLCLFTSNKAFAVETVSGLAGFFSIEYNGEEMANGEEFSNAKIIAGHKTLPVGSKVKITGDETGKSIMVTIQDNSVGKFPNAEIGLSKTAFVQLFDNDWDALYKGAVPVTIEILETTQETKPLTYQEIRANLKLPEKSIERKTREQIRRFQKLYERNQNPIILEKLNKLQEKNDRLLRQEKNDLQLFQAQHVAYQKGLASFYSSRFNGRGTAGGEIFSNEKLTAAHRTLPMGTKVLVKSVVTGNQVIVTVNDRGPYADGKIIDLTKEAFAQLFGGDWAHLSRGITNVELYLIDDEGNILPPSLSE